MEGAGGVGVAFDGERRLRVAVRVAVGCAASQNTLNPTA